MSAWLLEPVYWNWWLLGVVLMAIEAIVPYFFFLWMGVAALLVGFADTFGTVLMPDLAGLAVYLLMAVVLLWRPEGIFRKG